MQVLVYSKTDCPWCVKAKEYLEKHRIQFKSIVLDDVHERQYLYDRLHLEGKARTVPQVVLIDADGEVMVVGSYDKLLLSGIHTLNLLPMAADALPSDLVLDIQTRTTAAATTPTFELLPIDKFAIPTIEFWIQQALTELPENHPKITSARRRLAEVIAYQEIYGNRTPD